MESWIETITQFFAAWGYWGMLLAALAAGSILPIGSEVVFVLLLKSGLDPWLLMAAATAGNTLGGMSCYGLGMLGKREWIHRWAGVSDAKIDRASRFLQGRGAWMGFFSFLPYVGEAIAVVLGLMRSNWAVTTFSMALGKFGRYLLLYLAFRGIIPM